MRILTIHRSKGLTLDHVIVPIVECGNRDSIIKPDGRQRLAGEHWAIGIPSEDLAKRNPVLSAAWERKANEHFMEQLRLNYVALTRARKSTYAFVVQDEHESVVQFRDVLLSPFLGENARPTEMRKYGEVVYSDGTPFNFGYPKENENAGGETGVAIWTHAAGLSLPTRRTPSAAGSAVATTRSVKSMAVFFTTGFGAAAQKGIEAHAAFADIEWIDPSSPRGDLEREILASGFREAFVKPSPDATVWRERSYELLVGNCWETGQFDRVVFTGAVGNHSATIYDFKTNAKEPGESADAFAGRMSRLYSAQMASYRQALHRLTQIPLDRIETRLLLETTGQSVALLPKGTEM